MIVSYQKDESDLTPFEKNFLFEAPDKEPERKRNVKVITVPSVDGRRSDYTKIRGSKQEQQQTDELSDEDFDDIDKQVDSQGNGKSSDLVDDRDELSDEDFDDIDKQLDSQGNEDDEDYTQDADNNADDNKQSDDSDTDDEDYTQDADNNDDDNKQSDDSDDNKSEEQTTEDKKEKYKKFNLYKDFINLRTTTDNYISRLENQISDSIECNRMYKDITNRFKNINDLAYDYMVIKFNTANYFESFLFYQRMIAAMQFNIDLLSKVRKKEENLFKSQNNKIK